MSLDVAALGISEPSELVPDIWAMFPGYGRFVRLYRNNGEEPGGLVMYLDEHAVAFVETSEDEVHELEYGLLENALIRYLNYIDAGKFVVDTLYELGGYGDGSAIQGWRLLDDRAGLYLSPDEIMTNTVSMLLPFPIGANGHVLRSDGKISDKASHDALYHHGVCEPSLPYHGTSLHAVLANWWSMVAADDWAVDENGVAGGDSKWRMADTEQYAEAFKIEAACIPPDVDEDGEQESDEAGKESNDVGDEELDSSAKESVRTEDGDKPEREE
ncbi:hypothetical protein N0V91_009376 [Didymella pomorum]|uniref:Uncharacterized protein n=1 Tax=Didymella pomorum TaxID=749634 RepID=A0A9W8Z782_9PLEO|nr:hypothetical protein N0V91_009376 [Didymella pomorum]